MRWFVGLFEILSESAGPLPPILCTAGARAHPTRLAVRSNSSRRDFRASLLESGDIELRAARRRSAAVLRAEKAFGWRGGSGAPRSHHAWNLLLGGRVLPT